eukprot:11015503-Lingulodinium_polyedra.AAC.1
MGLRWCSRKERRPTSFAQACCARPLRAALRAAPGEHWGGPRPTAARARGRQRAGRRSAR